MVTFLTLALAAEDALRAYLHACESEALTAADRIEARMRMQAARDHLAQKSLLMNIVDRADLASLQPRIYVAPGFGMLDREDQTRLLRVLTADQLNRTSSRSVEIYASKSGKRIGTYTANGQMLTLTRPASSRGRRSPDESDGQQYG